MQATPAPLGGQFQQTIADLNKALGRQWQPVVEQVRELGERQLRAALAEAQETFRLYVPPPEPEPERPPWRSEPTQLLCTGCGRHRGTVTGETFIMLHKRFRLRLTGRYVAEIVCPDCGTTNTLRR